MTIVRVVNPIGLNQRKSARSDKYKIEIKGVFFGRRNKNINIRQNKKSGSIAEFSVIFIGVSEIKINMLPNKGKHTVIKKDL